MDKTHKTRGWGRAATGLAWVAAVGFARPGLTDQVAEAEATLAIDLVGQAEDEALLDLNYQPGFSFVLADEDLQAQINQLSKFFAEADWAKAFRLLTELDNDKLQVMVPLGGDGHYVLIKEELQRQLLSLPPEGRRAFQLYFDGQAGELLEAVKNHPLPGSEQQLAQAQALVDRLLASSIGSEAAVLLGDMYFERGLFDQAERYWRLALEQGTATGQDALELEAKRALAMQRAGKQDDARSLYNGLQARYGQAKIRAGGEEVDALALLGQVLDQPAAQGPGEEEQDDPVTLLPPPDAMPHWHLRFLDRGSQNAVNQVRGRSSYYSPPSDLLKHVPPVVADLDGVYFHWLGVVFALDRETGKLAWSTESMRDKAQSVVSRVQSNQGDPRNYQIALAEGTLLVTSTLNTNSDSAFTLRAYETETGLVSWSSDTRQDWTIGGAEDAQKGATALLGQVLVAEGSAYAIVYRSGKNTLFLRCFDPSTGEVDWTIPLGSAEIMTFQYTQVNRMPQPQLLMGPSLLYVMTNNGALVAVDVVASEVKWALRTDPPFGLGQPQTNNFIRGNQLGNKIEQMANTNGSGRMLLQDGTLYAKEHNGKTLYALDPSTGKLRWSADQLKPDAKFIGIDQERFYLMDRALQSYHVDGNHDLITKNGAQTGSPDHAGAILLGENILIYGNNKLRLFDTRHLDPAGKYENIDYLGANGGRLYRFDDLLIAIDTAQITAFKTPTDNN